MTPIAFFPSEVALVTMHKDGYELHLTSQEQHDEAKRWFTQSGIAFSEEILVLDTPSSTDVKWQVAYLAFKGKDHAVLVRIRWT